MGGEEIARILGELRSPDPQSAWTDFLDRYAGVILQAIRFAEPDEDEAADCFLYVCEKLAERGFRRLLRFRAEGPASFATWLRAVVRNLVIDRRRTRFGRARQPRALERLSSLDVEVYRQRFELKLSEEETLLRLRPHYPTLDAVTLTASEARIRQNIPTPAPRQGIVLEDCFELAERLPSSAANPEEMAQAEEERAVLGRALRILSKQEILLLRMRYGQGLTLEQVARLTGLKDAQTADRRLREIRQRLKQEMDGVRHGKVRSASV